MASERLHRGFARGRTRPRADSDEQRLAITIVKRDRLSGEMVRLAALDACPGAMIELTHDSISALSLLRARPVALLIMGLTFPEMDGLNLLAVIRRERLAGRVLWATTRSDERTREFARRYEVEGIFDTAMDDCSCLRRAIFEVAAGRRYYTHAGGFCDAAPGLDIPLSRLLSPRESDVFAVIGDGADDGRAAGLLGVSAHTVHNHRQRIMRKIQARTRAELVRQAVGLGFVRFYGQHTVRPGFDLNLGASASDRTKNLAAV